MAMMYDDDGVKMLGERLMGEVEVESLSCGELCQLLGFRRSSSREDGRRKRTEVSRVSPS